MLSSTTSFADYFAGIRRRTRSYIAVVPPDRLDWAPANGEMSCGEIIRHLIAAEAMFVGVVTTGRWQYAGHTADPADTLALLLAQLDTNHASAMGALRAQPDHVLTEQRPSLDGPPARAWRFLMAMVEHEIHHRSQLAVALSLMGVSPPHIFGLGVEDVIARATG